MTRVNVKTTWLNGPPRADRAAKRKPECLIEEKLSIFDKNPPLIEITSFLPRRLDLRTIENVITTTKRRGDAKNRGAN